MAERSAYRTKQREQLESFFRSNTERQFSIGEIADAVCEDCGVGKSTVYRLVSKMVEAGTLRRFGGEDGKAALYQYSGAELHCENHFHLKCTDCGKVVHLSCERIDEITRHIGLEHGFCVDISKCVLYGRCAECAMLGEISGKETKKISEGHSVQKKGML